MTSAADDSAVRGTEWRARLQGLVPEDIDRKRVAIIGCGSVGSFLASELVRSGVRRLLLIDPDRVEWPNLTRTVYGHRDVGRMKVEALSDVLRGIFADVQVETSAGAIQLLQPKFERVFGDVDLVISAVDEPQATGLVDRYCYGLGIPALFVALYKGARGGEVIVTLRDRTPCFHCSTGGVRKVAEDSGLDSVDRNRRDYGTNRLLAEVALGSDIHFVCCAAAKLALSALTMNSAPSELSRFLSSQLDTKCNYVMLGMTPSYFVFPMTHASAMGQHAFQSLWAQTDSNPECEVCGLEEHRAALQSPA